MKQLQVKCAHIEAKFYEEVHDLERKYAALYQPLFDKVRHVNFLAVLTNISGTMLHLPVIVTTTIIVRGLKLGCSLHCVVAILFLS